MDLEYIKIGTTLSIPFIKEVIERYVSPKVKDLLEKKGTSIKLTSHSFENQFEDYLTQAYNKYAAPSVLVLDNQKNY